MKLSPKQVIELHGINNLTKSLSFNMYDICFTKTKEEREAYLNYIDEQYNADRLTKILTHVAEIIGANILNIAKHYLLIMILIQFKTIFLMKFKSYII